MSFIGSRVVGSEFLELGILECNIPQPAGLV